MKRLTFLILISLSLISLTSCRVGYSFSGASVPAEAKSYSVTYFQNNSSLAPPSLSNTLTEALKDYINTRSKLSLIPTNGDLSFEGTIVNYAIQPLAIQSNDQAALTRLTITISVKYINKFDEKKNFDATFSRFADYSTSKNLSSVENELITTINRQLVDDIFNKAFNTW